MLAIHIHRIFDCMEQYEWECNVLLLHLNVLLNSISAHKNIFKMEIDKTRSWLKFAKRRWKISIQNLGVKISIKFGRDGFFFFSSFHFRFTGEINFRNKLTHFSMLFANIPVIDFNGEKSDKLQDALRDVEIRMYMKLHIRKKNRWICSSISSGNKNFLALIVFFAFTSLHSPISFRRL